MGEFKIMVQIKLLSQFNTFFNQNIVLDYIRTYTWDKKLESYVKSGILSQGKMPTVVSPDVYQKRFTEAMQRYFLMVPDKWTGFGADLMSI